MVMALLVLSLLMLPVHAPAADDHVHHHVKDAKFTQHFHDSLFNVTEKGLFSVELVLKGTKPAVGRNAFDVVIHDNRDRDVAGATLEVTPWTVRNGGHGVETRPRITEKGGGLYRVEDVDFTMAGSWQLRIKVRKGDHEDLALFNFPDINGREAVAQTGSPPGHQHAHTAAARPAVLDTAAALFTSEKRFRVSYEVEGGSVPMNRIHSWKLKITTQEGSPVRNAGVAVDGGMPEHGHGLPTKPRVTADTDKTLYLVEGMKFTMPGWWIVTFTVSADGKTDSVTFNLDLK